MSGSQKPSSTRKYTASSCHELGYLWNIEAPAELGEDVLQRLQEVLVNWYDFPEQRHLNDVLNAPYALEDYGLMDSELDALRLVRFEVDVVHRQVWTQDWEAEVKGGAS